MGIIKTVKEKFGLVDEGHHYRCNDCDSNFRSHVEPDSVWLRCTECESDEVELIKEAS